MAKLSQNAEKVPKTVAGKVFPVVDSRQSEAMSNGSIL
jgi:hypothetical protein